MTTTDRQPRFTDGRAAEAAAKKERIRAAVLRFASDIADGPDPSRILQVARPVMAWIDQATGDTDRDRRFTAVSQAHTNRPRSQWRQVQMPAEKFLAEAAALYAFLSA